MSMKTKTRKINSREKIDLQYLVCHQSIKTVVEKRAAAAVVFPVPMLLPFPQGEAGRVRAGGGAGVSVSDAKTFRSPLYYASKLCSCKI